MAPVYFPCAWLRTAPLLIALAVGACAPASNPPPAPSPAPRSAPAAVPAASVVASASASSDVRAAPTRIPAKRIALDVGESSRGVRACAVLEEGGVICWGGTNNAAPHRLPGVRDAIDVSLGMELVVLKADHSALVFYPEDFSTPPRPFPLATVRSVSQLSFTMCAAGGDGKVTCWDYDNSPAPRPPRPVVVKGIQDAVVVGAGQGYGCALEKNGSVSCWEHKRTATSYLVSQLKNVVELQVGYEEACARDASRTIQCFLTDPHKNVLARIGQGDAVGLLGTWTKGYGAKDKPFGCVASEAGVTCQHLEALGDDGWATGQSTGLVPGTQDLKVRQLVTSRTATCALDDKGIVQCWGDNHQALLGQPDPGHLEQLKPVPGLPAMRELVAGTYDTCGLTTEREVYCWGPSPKKMAGLSGIDRILGNNCCTCAYTPSGEATCFDRYFGMKRTPALDGLQEVVFSTDVWGTIAAIGKSKELLVGASRDLDALKMSSPKGVGPVQRVAVSPSGHLLAQEVGGKLWALDTSEGKRGTGLRRLPELDGAVSLDQWGTVLLSGGKLFEVSLRGGTKVMKIQDSSPLASLLGPWRCGMTATGAFGCLERDRLQVHFEGIPAKRIAVGSEHQSVLDPSGAVLCRGDNLRGQCMVSVGLAKSATPVEVLLR